METNKPKPMKRGSPDNFQTPEEALEILIPFIPKSIKKIWESAEGEGNLSNALWHKGYDVIGSDILGAGTHDYSEISSLDLRSGKSYVRGFKRNFLNWKPEEFDMIITNPPFSIKQKFLERCFELERPFALLLPLTTLESEKRQKLFRKKEIQIIIPNKRYNFKTPSGKGSGSWFATARFTYGLKLPKQLNFVDVRHGKNN